MKILLAGPGTGKTTKIKTIIAEQYPNAENIKVISFTNATVNDLSESFAQNQNVSCSTLHSFALGLNHLPELHILLREEQQIIESLSNKLGIAFADLCQIIKCIPFDGMIQQCVTFIKANPAYAKEKIGNLDLLLIDEFQDFNPVEQELVKLTSQLASETIILGDDDQSIYGFKDADPNGIIDLFENETIEKIPHENICYRCPDEIVDYCTKLLQKNLNRIPKEWKNSGKPGHLLFQQFLRQEECDNYILQRIAEIRENDNESSTLILSPVGFAVESLKQQMQKQQVEFNDCWPIPIDAELLANVWWLNAIYSDNKLPFIIFLLKYYGLFNKNKIIDLIKDRIQKNFDETQLMKDLIDTKYLPEPFATYILQPTPVDEMLQQHKEFHFAANLLNSGDLQGSVTKLAAAIRPRQEFEKGKINLMSIHRSKGLQAEYVFINGLVTGILPNNTKGIDSIEAQRRLLFVGMTRTLQRLELISTVQWDGKDVNKVDKKQFEYKFWNRKYSGKTSTFIQEIMQK
jgi:DNA helicase II / ATP-dependent DNA helicase PcrA